MANLTPLRNIHLSGGLFTENLLLKIRDKKDQIPEVQWITFGEKWQEEKKRYYEVWDWAKRLFGEISDSLDTWTIKDRFEKWIKPLLQKLGHKSELKPSIDLTRLSEEDQDNILNRIQVSYQIKNHAKIGLHICEDDNFDERNNTNYQKKSQHDHFQRFILLNEGVRWGLLSNGKHIRLLGEYSNIYAKGYVQFNLDSIFINKDESEFWVFYALIHHSRFKETYGLNPDDWIDKLKKKWKTLSKKLSSEDADINSTIISEKVLKIYSKNLNEFIGKANNKGIMAIKSSDSEIFMQNLKEKGLDLGEIGRDFYLKEFDSVISDINKNLSIIQRLQKRSQAEGIEVGKKLRENVKNALELMGEGLINSSKSFIYDILKGNLEIKDFYQELLRITYRIIFILYAEAKDLLPGVATIYYNDLGLTFLRKKAQQPIRDDQNTDLWYRLLLLFRYFDIGELALGINAFSGELFNPDNIPLILNENYNLSLNNSSILKIIRELTIVDLGIGLQSIDYTQIGEEEIGSIYEALLDFQPRYIKKDSQIYHFILEEIDTERKGSGTYYTPKGLIDILLKTGLKPVIENKLNGLETKEEKLKAILDLKICDPACGGGSFLLASIDYLGKIYAQIKTEEDFPEDNLLRQARRKILQNCIYGVDLNPMALELAKISLWLKASVANKPLTFLDNHLKEGNSLIGFTRKVAINDIPSLAFNSVKGNTETGAPSEYPKFVQDAKNRLKDFSISKASSKGKTSVQKTIFPYKDSEKYSQVANKVFIMGEDSRTQLQEKIRCYLELLKSNSWRSLNLQYNLWTSSFLWDMGENYIKETPTATYILKAKKGEISSENQLTREVNRLREQYKIFNWFLEFPDVFNRNNSGFDCILMNPPWEVLQLKEMEFFAGKSQEIIETQNESERSKEIKKLDKTNPNLFTEYVNQYRKVKKESHYIKKSNFFPFGSKGAVNLYSCFIERAITLLNPQGKMGGILSSGILTGKNTAKLLQNLVISNSVDSILDFHNNNIVFPIGHRQHFVLMTLSNKKRNERPIIACSSAWNPLKVKKALDNFEEYKNLGNLIDFYKEQEKVEIMRRMDEGGSLSEINKADFELLNPNTITFPLFRRRKDLQLIKKAYLKTNILIKRDEKGDIIEDYWQIKFKRMMSDSKYYKTMKYLKSINAKPEKEEYKGGIWRNNEKKFFPLYSGSSIWFYDHRYNEVIAKKDQSLKRKADYFKVPIEKHSDPNYLHLPMYWVEENSAYNNFPDNWFNKWFLAYRKITGPNNQRNFIITAIPFYPTDDNLINITFENFQKYIICLLANMASIPFDFIAKNKISSMAFAYFAVEQLPVFPPSRYGEELYDYIKKRVIELVYTAWGMKDFAYDFGLKKDSNPFKWDFNHREELIADLDALFAILYGYNREELEYILNTFYVIRNNEQKEFGEFRTKKLVLKAFDNFENDKNKRNIMNI